MKTVSLILGAQMPTPQGLSNTLSHSQVADVTEKDGWLRLTLDNGVLVVYNLNIVLQYAVDPHGSVLKPQAGLVRP